MKKIFTAGFFISAMSIFAQVGVNTVNPKSTMDISGKVGLDGKSPATDITGLIAPRLTREELTAKGNSLYGTDQRGAVVYITDVSAGDAASQRVNVTSVGYYYFDGSVWQRLLTSPVNIYNADGTLTADRTVTMNGRSLTFGSTSQRTVITANSGIRQEGVSTGNNASIMVAAPDRNSNGVESRLTMQAFSESGAQLLAAQDATSIDLGTNATTNPSYIRLVTSAGSNATGTEKVRITSDGKVGIGQSIPSNKLHIVDTADPLRLQGVQNTTDTNTSSLVLDANGVVKTSFLQRTKFGGYINSNFTMTQPAAGTSIGKIIIDNEQIDLEDEYDTTTGFFTPITSGVYTWEFAMSYNATGATDADYGTVADRMVIGIASNATSQWVSRANVEAVTDTRYFLAKGIVSLVAGQSYYFGVAAAANKSVTLIATPTGGTGSGIGTYFSFTRLK